MRRHLGQFDWHSHRYDFVRCSNCGRTYQASADFCNWCDRLIAATEPQSIARYPETPSADRLHQQARFWKAASYTLLLLSGFYLAVPAVLLFYHAAKLRRRALAIQQRVGALQPAEDPRAPVVFLRSFRRDGARLTTTYEILVAYVLLGAFSRSFLLTFEECIVGELFRFGPVVAADAPESTGDVPVLGATRLRLGREWKARVRELVTSAGLIVLMLDDTPGTRWELEQALTSEDVGSYFFLTPLARTIDERSEYASSYAALKGAFPALPEFNPRLVGFSFESLDSGPRQLLSPAPFPSGEVRAALLGGALDEWITARTRLHS